MRNADCATGQMHVGLALPRVHRIEGHPANEDISSRHVFAVLCYLEIERQNKIRVRLCHDT